MEGDLVRPFDDQRSSRTGQLHLARSVSMMEIAEPESSNAYVSRVRCSFLICTGRIFKKVLSVVSVSHLLVF